jgi:hypothetical protein
MVSILPYLSFEGSIFYFVKRLIYVFSSSLKLTVHMVISHQLQSILQWMPNTFTFIVLSCALFSRWRCFHIYKTWTYWCLWPNHSCKLFSHIIPNWGSGISNYILFGVLKQSVGYICAVCFLVYYCTGGTLWDL